MPASGLFLMSPKARSNPSVCALRKRRKTGPQYENQNQNCSGKFLIVFFSSQTSLGHALQDARKVRRILDAMFQGLAGELNNDTKNTEQIGQTIVQNRAA